MGSRRPSVLDLWPVYQSEPSVATAGSCGWELGVGTSHSLRVTLADEAAPALWAITACLATNRATWGLGLKSTPRKTIQTTTRTAIVRLHRNPWECSGTLLRRDGVEGRPTLFDFLAATVLAKDIALFVVDEGKDS